MTVLSSDPADDPLTTTFGSPGGRLLDEGPWREIVPAEVLDHFIAWVGRQAFDIRHRSWITAGGSGAIIARVHLVRPDRNLRGSVLKLVPPGLVDEEARNIEAAENSPLHFSRAHILPLTKNDRLGESGWGVHLMDVAERNGRPLRPLSELAGRPDFGRRCAGILRSTVVDWNAEGGDPKPLETTAAAFLTGFVTAYRTPIEGLREFAREHGVDWDHPEATVWSEERGETLANPFALLRGRPLSAKVTIHLGNGHGDLHADNILDDPEELENFEQFLFIDPGRFSRTAPISRDAVKLLLSVNEQWARVNPKAWQDPRIRRLLAEITAGGRPPIERLTPELASQRTTVEALDAAAGAWAAKRHLTDEWRVQHHLTLIGAALRRVGATSLSPEWREWHFEVAALASSTFIDAAEITRTESSRGGRPREGTRSTAASRTVKQGTDPPPHRRSRSAWLAVATVGLAVAIACAYFFTRPDHHADGRFASPGEQTPATSSPPLGPTPVVIAPEAAASSASPVPSVLFDQEGYQLSVSSSIHTNDQDKIDLDTACPGWGDMGWLGPERCGDLAELVADQEGLHTGDDRPGFRVLDPESGFDECAAVPAARLNSQLNLADFAKGLRLCVHTDENRIALVDLVRFTVDEKIVDDRKVYELDTVVIDFKVWTS